MKKGGDIVGVPATTPAPAPAAKKSAFSQFFSNITDVANVAKEAATETVGIAAESVTKAVDVAGNTAKKLTSAAAATASTAANAAVDSNPIVKTANYAPVGGRRRRKRGGTGNSYFSLKNLASVANPISGILTAKPQVWVGGKTRKKTCNKRHKHTKSCKSKTKKGNRKKRSRKSKFPFSASLKRLIKM